MFDYRVLATATGWAVERRADQARVEFSSCEEALAAAQRLRECDCEDDYDWTGAKAHGPV